MPRTAPESVVESAAPQSIVASAQFLPKITGLGARRSAEGWQQEAWMHYDNNGELRYATAWFSNALSRAQLLPAKMDADGVVQPIRSGPVFDMVNGLFGGPSGQAQLLRSMGQHYFIAGEWYIIVRNSKGADITEIVSSNAIKVDGDRWTIDYGDNIKVTLSSEDAAIRVWNPHPLMANRADSPVRAVLPTLAEIATLNRHIGAQIRSRLAGAGVLLMPSEVSFTSAPGTAAMAAETGADPFMITLAGAMMASIEDPGDPSALVPIVVRVPGEHVDKVRHMTFWSDLDQQAVPQRDAAIRRLALGLDLPPEVLLGTSDVNHWGAWQIEESTIKAHIEPALGVIAAALTQSVLRRISDDPDLMFVFDTASLRLRPNRSKEALELYDRGEIGGAATRRETGFTDSDKPDEEEEKRWMLRRIVAGYASASPEQIEEALRMLGVDFPKVSTGGDSRNPKPDPSLVDHPTNELPERQVAALETACDALVWRALERTGNRLRNLAQSHPEGIEPAEMYLHVSASGKSLDRLLEGAWSPLPRILDGIDVDHRGVEKNLDAYVRSIVTTQKAHSKEAMMGFVNKALT